MLLSRNQNVFTADSVIQGLCDLALATLQLLQPLQLLHKWWAHALCCHSSYPFKQCDPCPERGSVGPVRHSHSSLEKIQLTFGLPLACCISHYSWWQWHRALQSPSCLGGLGMPLCHKCQEVSHRVAQLNVPHTYKDSEHGCQEAS